MAKFIVIFPFLVLLPYQGVSNAVLQHNTMGFTEWFYTKLNGILPSSQKKPSDFMTWKSCDDQNCISLKKRKWRPMRHTMYEQPVQLLQL